MKGKIHPTIHTHTHTHKKPSHFRPRWQSFHAALSLKIYFSDALLSNIYVRKYDSKILTQLRIMLNILNFFTPGKTEK